MKDIPVIKIQGRTIPEVWEKSLLETWEKGFSIKTQYDKPEDPASKDCTMIMVIEEPLGEPRIHKNFPAGLEQLEIYRQEVVDGAHDHWIKPEEGAWTYTYHQRLFGYQPAWKSDLKIAIPLGHELQGRGDVMTDGKQYWRQAETTIKPLVPINQIEFIIDSLVKSMYSRRAFGITYMPSYDMGTEDPPCLQRVWCRISEDDGQLYLNMDTYWRSRDAFKAAFMNMFALTDLQRYIAMEISHKIKKHVSLGRYVDVNDSYHIYGSYFEEFKGFLDSVKNRKFEERVWNSNENMIQAAFEDGRDILKREKETGIRGLAR